MRTNERREGARCVRGAGCGAAAGRAGRAGGVSRPARLLAGTLLAACLLAPATAWGAPADGAAGDGAATAEAALGVAPLEARDGGIPLALTGMAKERSVLVRVSVEPAEGAELQEVGFAFDAALEERAVVAESSFEDGVLSIVASAGDDDLGAGEDGSLALGVIKVTAAPAGARVTVTVERVEAADARYVERATAGPAAGPVTLAVTDGAGGSGSAGGDGGTGNGSAVGGGSGDGGGSGAAGSAGSGADGEPGGSASGDGLVAAGTPLAPTGDAAPLVAIAMAVVVVIALVVLIVACRRR